MTRNLHAWASGTARTGTSPRGGLSMGVDQARFFSVASSASEVVPNSKHQEVFSSSHFLAAHRNNACRRLHSIRHHQRCPSEYRLPQSEQAPRCPPHRGSLSQAQDTGPGPAHLGASGLAMGWYRRECEGFTVRQRGMLIRARVKNRFAAPPSPPSRQLRLTSDVPRTEWSCACMTMGSGA
jgi:hypothetical protein